MCEAQHVARIDRKDDTLTCTCIAHLERVQHLFLSTIASLTRFYSSLYQHAPAPNDRPSCLCAENHDRRSSCSSRIHQQDRRIVLLVHYAQKHGDALSRRGV